LKASVFGQLHIALISPVKARDPSQLQIPVEESKMMDDPAEDYYLVWTGRVSARVRKDATTTRSAWLGHQYPSHQNSDIVPVNPVRSSRMRFPPS